MTPEGMLFEFDCHDELVFANWDLGIALEEIQEGNYDFATNWVNMAIQGVDSVIRRTIPTDLQDGNA